VFVALFIICLLFIISNHYATRLHTLLLHILTPKSKKFQQTEYISSETKEIITTADLQTKIFVVSNFLQQQQFLVPQQTQLPLQQIHQ